MGLGDEIRVALRTQPGSEITGTISGFPPALSEGALDLRSGLPSMRELVGITSFPVLIELPGDVPLETLQFGASGTALVMTDKAGPISPLAEILFWVTQKLNYL